MFYALPTKYIHVFLWTWEQAAIIYLYSINWLVFITEVVCVYCAARVEYVNVVEFNVRSTATQNSGSAPKY